MKMEIKFNYIDYIIKSKNIKENYNSRKIYEFIYVSLGLINKEYNQNVFNKKTIKINKTFLNNNENNIGKFVYGINKEDNKTKIFGKEFV